jgi:hypothetical protein
MLSAGKESLAGQLRSGVSVVGSRCVLGLETRVPFTLEVSEMKSCPCCGSKTEAKQWPSCLHPGSFFCSKKCWLEFEALIIGGGLASGTIF